MLGVVWRDLTDAAAVRRAGADFVEPYVVGNYVTVAEAVVTPHQPGDGLHPSFVVQFPGEVKLSTPGADPALFARYLDATAAVLAPEAAPGAFVVLGSGGARAIPEGVDRAEGERLFLERLVAARDAYAQVGIELLLEPLNPAESNIARSFREAVELLDGAGLDDVRLVWDTYHATRCDEDLRFVADHVHRIAHVHHSGPDRLPPSRAPRESLDLLRVVLDRGYAGHVSLECAFETLDEVADSVALVKAYLAGEPVTA